METLISGDRCYGIPMNFSMLNPNMRPKSERGLAEVIMLCAVVDIIVKYSQRYCCLLNMEERDCSC